MAIVFTPHNNLEKAIQQRNIKLLVQAIAEEECLTYLAPASNLGFECFPDEIVFSVLLIAATQEQLKTMTNGWFWGHLKVGKRLKDLIDEAVAPLPLDPSPAEKALIRAIMYRDNEEIIRLITADGAKFYGFAPELLLMLPELSNAAVVTFLRDGLSPKLKAIVFGILLKEVEKPDLLECFSYAERVRYANLMIHLLAGEPVTADVPLFPENKNFQYFYYFDPAHQYDPAD